MAPGRRDHYGDGAWYDAEYVHMGADLPYYRRVGALAARAGRPILELCCGTGRLSIPMAEAGATVRGLDLSPAMIAQAEAKRAALPAALQARLSFSVGDMCALSDAPRVEDQDIVLAFNGILQLTEDVQLSAALRGIWRQLGPRGRLYLDLYNPLPAPLQREPEGRYDPQQMILPGGQRVIVSENSAYDPRSQLRRLCFYYQPVDAAGAPEGEELLAELSLRQLYPRELDHWLSSHELQVEEDWDGFDRVQPFTATGGRRVMVLSRA